MHQGVWTAFCVTYDVLKNGQSRAGDGSAGKITYFNREPEIPCR